MCLTVKYQVPVMYFLCSEFLRLRGNKMGVMTVRGKLCLDPKR
jgi:hypothetical protein